MKHAQEMVRVVAASLAVLASCTFVLNYDELKYHDVVECGGSKLPVMTEFVTAHTGWVFLLFPAVLVSGILCRKRPLAVTVICSLAWLFALSWSLLCILAWYAPFSLL